ncbi:Exoglucanase-like protein [Hapsidospora chrysogenum ATCC 11550]|uniref:Glucanase n=1 Tax=Hapsidospora chrysogenum (strain ATCC 11550 / CBS 779.69 / DSM 880 / IAM 14645 / JCM 23072 / IMI 49137) TaxID=857340 RepID=A0A086SW50_HAPC1|nr:Exoglucanase-like protein [Hapsidospora chrysogenum ATCC 11550]
MYALALAAILAVARAQKAGTLQSETHPRLSWSECTSSGCQNKNGEVVIDANWRWLHVVGGSENCYEGNEWTSACSGEDDCTENCAVEGADYSTTYGVTTSGNALTLKFVTEHEYGKNIGSRLYLMASQDEYQMFTLMDNELAFDVDLSTIECGMNSALYFVAMESDGGMSTYPTNEAGAKFGTGYCDAQCARDLKFVGGKANVEGWEPSTNDANSGVGNYGSCCAEIDIWESNAHAFAFTPHACEENTYHVCEDQNCGGTYSDDRFAGKCDANGCDYNPYRMGNPDFYGKGKTVDTTRKFTVVSQFTADKLTQFLVQNGQKFEIPAPTFDGISDSSDITDDLCNNQFEVFTDRNRYSEVGGWSQLQQALTLPMVLVMSIWDDHYANMLWLDSIYPPEKEGQPGAARGPCPQDSGVPSEVEEQYADSSVVWSNIRFGPIGSTVSV